VREVINLSKTVKRLIIALVIIAVVCGGVFAAVKIIRAANRKPVNVYSARDFTMTNYWGDSSETYGSVTTDRIQKVYSSDTQTVTEIYVGEGDQVKKGDLLLAYDTTLSDIDLEKAEISLSRMELDYENAKRELSYIKSLTPHSSRIVVPDSPNITYDTRTTPSYISGKGTMDDPLYILYGDDDLIDDSLLDTLFSKAESAQKKKAATKAVSETETAPADPHATTEPETKEPETKKSDSTEPDASESGTKDTETTEPETTEPETTEPETTEPETTEPETTEPETTEPETTEPETTEPETPAPEKKLTDIYAAFVTRDHDALNGAVTRAWGLKITRTDGGFTFRYYEPVLSEAIMRYDEVPEPYYEEYGSDYTSAEIAQMRSDKEKEIADLESSLEVAKVDLERLKAEVNDGRVYAQMDGLIKAVRDPDEALAANEAVIELSAGGGYYIRVAMSELELDSMQIGQSVTVNSWETGEVCEGSVVEILSYPTTDANSWSNGNTNVSYYPFVVFVNEDANLRDGSYVSVTYEKASTNTDSIYVENIFVRSENGRNFMYVEGEGGLLEKRSIRTGKSLWGSYTEVLSGLSTEDHIAFPYGKDVMEGAKTNEAAADEFYESMRY